MSDLPPPPPTSAHTYESRGRRPVDILVFRVDPDDVDDVLRVDHEAWTLGEASTPHAAAAASLARPTSRSHAPETLP